MEVEVLIDTGASSNYVSAALLDKLKNSGMKIHMNKEKTTSVKLANKQMETSEWTATLPLLINNQLFNEEFHVLQCLSFEVILGCQFLRVNETTIRMFINKEKVSFLERPLTGNGVQSDSYIRYPDWT